MSDVLSQFRRNEPVPFDGPGGFTIPLHPIKFGDYRAIMAWWREEKDKPGFGELLERRLFALAVGCKEEEVDDLDPAMVEATAREVGHRCGLYKEQAEKKDDPASTTTTSSSPPTSPLPAG